MESNTHVDAVPLVDSYAACTPNISPRGRRRRRRFGFEMSALGVLLLGIMVVLGAPWYWRLLLFFPATLAAFGFIQVQRNTCVSRAREGTFEHDDYSRTIAPRDQVVLSRRVARGINRDAILVGVIAAVLAVATVTIR